MHFVWQEYETRPACTLVQKIPLLPTCKTLGRPVLSCGGRWGQEMKSRRWAGAVMPAASQHSHISSGSVLPARRRQTPLELPWPQHCSGLPPFRDTVLSNHCHDYVLDLELQACCTIKYNFVMTGQFKKPSNTIWSNNYMGLNGKVTFWNTIPKKVCVWMGVYIKGAQWIVRLLFCQDFLYPYDCQAVKGSCPALCCIRASCMQILLHSEAGSSHTNLSSAAQEELRLGCSQCWGCNPKWGEEKNAM